MKYPKSLPARPPMHSARITKIATEHDLVWLSRDLGFSMAEMRRLLRLFA